MKHSKAAAIFACWAVLGLPLLPQLLCSGANSNKSEISARKVVASDGGVWIMTEAGLGPEGSAPLFIQNGNVLSVIGIHP